MNESVPLGVMLVKSQDFAAHMAVVMSQRNLAEYEMLAYEQICRFIENVYRQMNTVQQQKDDES